jgi:hypothetical protein
MPENIGGPSAPFNTQIPSITDNADIQTAFRLYHYGSNTSTPTTIPENSLAGHLNVMNLAKLNKTPEQIPTSTNLNTYVSTGFYTQIGTPTGANYPSNFSGLLTVVNDGGVVFQSYQVVGASETGDSVNTLNRTWWRFNFAGSWRPWRTFVESSDFSTLGDARYYTQSAANTLFATNNFVNSTFLTIAEANQRQYVLENQATTEYTLQLSDVGKVVSASNTNNSTLITVPTNSAVAFPLGTIINIYSSTPQNVVVLGAIGVTVRPFASNSFRLFGQYTEVSLRKRATNEWVASGNIIQT